MRKLSNLILMIMIGAALSSCTSTKYKVIHKPNVLLENCIFEMLTEEEKLSVLPVPKDKKNLTHDDRMIELVGRKISRNYKNCIFRHERNQDINNAHNEAHKVD